MSEVARCQNGHHWVVWLSPGKRLLPDDDCCPSCGEDADVHGSILPDRMLLILSVPRTGSASEGNLAGGDMVVANMQIPASTGLGEMTRYDELLDLMRAELPDVYERLASLLSGYTFPVQTEVVQGGHHE